MHKHHEIFQFLFLMKSERWWAHIFEPKNTSFFMLLFQ